MRAIGISLLNLHIPIETKPTSLKFYRSVIIYRKRMKIIVKSKFTTPYNVNIGIEPCPIILTSLSFIQLFGNWKPTKIK